MVCHSVQSQLVDAAGHKAQFGGNVDFVADNRAIFDVGGNKYRLITFIAYKFGHMYIKFVGTHAEYDKIDAETVSEH